MSTQVQAPISSDFELESYIAAEQSILGAVFLSNAVLDDLVPYLTADDFTITTHNLLWRAMVYNYNRNEPVDLITMTAALARYKRLDEVGGVQYLSRLAAAVPTASSAMHYANIVKEHTRKRRGVELAEKIRRITTEQEFESEDDYYSAVDKLVSAMRPDTSGKMRSFAETEEDYFTYLETQTDTVKTGFHNFDEWSNGVGRGWLYILAGRPSIGKTAKALQMAAGMASQQVGQVLFWSQEMTFNQLKSRMLSNMSGVNYGRLRKKEIEEFEKKMLRKTYRELDNSLHVEECGGVTIDHVRATARQMQRTRGPIAAIFVDYLTKMDIRQEKGQTWSRAVGEVTKRAKWLAQECNCPFIMLAQLSREGVDEPNLHHLRDSGEIEQDADVVEFLYEDAEETHPEGVIVQSKIAKGRDIGTKKFKYLFKGHVQRYEDYNGTGVLQPTGQARQGRGISGKSAHHKRRPYERDETV